MRVLEWLSIAVRLLLVIRFRLVFWSLALQPASKRFSFDWFFHLIFDAHNSVDLYALAAQHQYIRISTWSFNYSGCSNDPFGVCFFIPYIFYSMRELVIASNKSIHLIFLSICRLRTASHTWNAYVTDTVEWRKKIVDFDEIPKRKKSCHEKNYLSLSRTYSLFYYGAMVHSITKKK